MSDIPIKDLRRDVQNYIEQYQLDINKDSLVNKDNGELARLISASGVDDISQLYNTGRLRCTDTNMAIGSAVLGVGIAYTGGKLTSHKAYINACRKYNTQLEKANEIIQRFNGANRQRQYLSFWGDSLRQVQVDIAKDARYTQEERNLIIKTIDETLEKHGETQAQLKSAENRTKQIATELRQLFKKPFLLRAGNSIRMLTIAGVGLSILSTLFFGTRAALKSESTKKLAFQS